MKILSLVVLILVFLTVGCKTREVEIDNPEKGYHQIKSWYYDEELFEEAIQKYSELRSKHPYSKYSVMAELDIADAYYQQEKWPEASVSYEEFAKLHPKHPKYAFALYRNAWCYFNQRNSSENRDQFPTKEAEEAFQYYIQQVPTGEHIAEARKYIKICQEDIVKQQLFIADFYMRKELFHAALYRYGELIKEFPNFLDLIEIAYYNSTICLFEMVKQKEETPDSDKNIFVARYTVEELRKQGVEMASLYINKYPSGRYKSELKGLINKK